jgi:membrane-anchored protein YejM (alkaline phosphatase superfamily)
LWKRISKDEFAMVNMNDVVNRHDLLLITLDALRYDVAQQALSAGLTPNLAGLMQGNPWQERHSPGNFTYAAHQAFFAGFLPTPVAAGLHPRLFALRFEGSETTGETTMVFDAPDIVAGFAGLGYHTACVGGVGFFNKRSPLGNTLPGLFQESHWQTDFGVTDCHSTQHQVNCALQIVERLPVNQRIFLFINISAIHQPNRFFLEGATEDSLASHQAALAYVDQSLALLFAAMKKRAPVFCIICSDHGTAYGEDGYYGHRLSHPVVWTVPYTEFFL